MNLLSHENVSSAKRVLISSFVCWIDIKQSTEPATVLQGPVCAQVTAQPGLLHAPGNTGWWGA